MAKTVAIAIYVMLFLLCIISWVRRHKYTETYAEDIPRIIWTYWHSDTIPIVVQKCIETWQIQNPSYTIIVLNNAKIKQFCNVDLDTMNIVKEPMRQSDFARLLIMVKYGGIWMDATIICTKPLDWIQSNYDLSAFTAPQTTNKHHPIIENWFFVARPGSAFITDWLNEAIFMTTFDNELAYIDYIKNNMHTDIQGLESLLPYLVMHLCATVVEQRNPAKYNLNMMHTYPFDYLHAGGWDSRLAFKKLCMQKELQTPLVKMRGTERDFLIDNVLDCAGNTVDPMISNVINWRH